MADSYYENTRAAFQWAIIVQHVDFKDKFVVDLGCGYGDILRQTWKAGAKLAIGYDNDPKIIARHTVAKQLLFVECDIETLSNYNSEVDIAICFSVLPYLKAPKLMLRWMAEHAKQSLIECQLAGDGPGCSFLKSNTDLEQWLAKYFTTVELLGATTVIDRDCQRGIWLCQ